jgi:putative spermidine/putrescine transport system permease protein
MLLTPKKLGAIGIGLNAFACVVSLLLMLPVIFVILLSFGESRWLLFPPPGWTFRWYEAVFSKPGWIQSLWLSVEIGLYVVAAALLLGVPASFALVRGKFIGKTALNALFTAPLIVPYVILAVSLYAVVLKAGIAGTKIAFVISHLILALPFVIISVSNSLRSFDASLERAAMICGATRAEAILRVTLPSIRHGIFAGALFAFLISWDEVILSIFMSGPNLQTLPVRMWSMIRADLSPEIAAVASIMVVSSMLMILGIMSAWRK